MSNEEAGPSHLNHHLNPPKSNWIENLRLRINEAERTGNFTECLTLCSNLPESDEFVLLKAKYLVLTCQPKEASEILCGILKNDPQNAEAISTLGLVFYHQGNLKKSVEVFQNALQVKPELNEIKELAQAQKLLDIMNGVPDAGSDKEMFTPAVIRSLEVGFFIDPTNREMTKTLLFHHGVAKFKNDLFRSAMKSFTEALKLDATNIELFMFRAKSYIELHFFDDAMIDLLEVEKLNDNGNTKIAMEIEALRRKIGKVYIAKTNYEILEVQRNAADREIAQSFKSLSLLHQVNLSKASTSAEKRKIVFKFKCVENAFAILSNSANKKKYDKFLKKQEATIECPTLTTCCVNIGNGYQCCCGGIGSCMHNSCTGFGSCLKNSCTGFGNCMSGCLAGIGKCLNFSCYHEGVICCRKLKFCNVFVALMIFTTLYVFFKFVV